MNPYGKEGARVELLVKRTKQGDAEAFITLIEENKQSMYKVARGFLNNEILEELDGYIRLQ